MKTLFGERKSVKTLAFILALALILPLLPAASVFGLTIGTSYSVTFQGVSANGGEVGKLDAVLFTDSKGETYVQSFADDKYTQDDPVQAEITWAGSNNVKAKYEKDKKQVTLSGDALKVSLTPGGTEFVFGAVGYGLSEGEYVIFVQDGSSPKQIIQPSSDGYYHISLAKITNDSITIFAEKASTVSFPSEVVAATAGYSLGDVNYGDNLLVAGADGKVEFTVTPYEDGMTPAVTAIVDSERKTVTAKGESPDANNTYTYELNLNGEHKDVKKVEIALKTRMLTVTPPATNGAYKVTNLADEVPYGSALSFDVIVTDGFDVPTVKYSMGATNNKTLDRVGTTYTIPRVTGDVTITIDAGEEQKFDAQLVVDDQKATIDTGTASGWTNITYNQSRDFKVKPTNGYKVTSITVKSGNDILASNTNSDTIHVSNITSDLRVVVTTAPIVITVEYVNRPENYNTSDTITYDEFMKGNSESFAQKVPTYADIVNSVIKKYNGQNRFGATLDTSKGSSGMTVAEGTTSIASSDVTITVTFNWKINPQEYFVLDLVGLYDQSSSRMIFTTELKTNTQVTSETISILSDVQYSIKAYGLFYGQYATTLTNQQSAIALQKLGMATAGEDGKPDTGIFLENGEEVSDEFSLKDNDGEVYFYAYGGQGIEDVNFNAYTHRVNGVNPGVGRSAISFYQITIGESEEVITFVSDAANVNG